LYGGGTSNTSVAGAQGIIVVTYTSSIAAPSTANFFEFF
jgi:hypothetical protein